MGRRSGWTLEVFALASFALGMAALLPVSAASTREEVLEACRNSVGRPIVQACMSGHRGDPAAFENCRMLARPRVMACMASHAPGVGSPAPVQARGQERGSYPAPKAVAIGPGSSHEAIIEACRESVGRPLVIACLNGRRGDQAALAACKAKATPQVRACVVTKEQQIAMHKAAPAAPKIDPASLGDASSAPKTLAAPPRTIADITAILDQEKPDAAKIKKMQADANASVPAGASAADLAQFYYDRSAARAGLGRAADALADAQKALEVGGGGLPKLLSMRIHQQIGIQYGALGDPKKALAATQDILRNGNQPGVRGSLISASRLLIQFMLQTGDIGQADAFSRRVAGLVAEARGSPNPNWRTSYEKYGKSWEAEADLARALIFEARGQYPEALNAYKRSETFRRASIKDMPKWDYPPPVSQIELAADQTLLAIANIEAKQGHLSEAEADARKALLAVLRSVGKFHPAQPKYLVGLASILTQQGRYSEAESLVRSALDVQKTLGIGDDTPTGASILSQLASIQTLQGKTREGAETFALLEKATMSWEPGRREAFLISDARINALYASRKFEQGTEISRQLIKKNVGRFGDGHFNTASARALLGVGLARLGRDDEALEQLKLAIPVMLSAARENTDDDDATTLARRTRSLQVAAEAYIGVLARSGRSDAAIQTLTLADAIRGRSVQQALTASSARMNVTDPALAALVRQEQDDSKQIGALLGILNNSLSLPPGERDEKGVRGINAAIVKVRADRDKARQAIASRFPAYSDLIDPKPPSLEQVRSALKPGEALLSIYLGRDSSYIWAVPKDGDVQMARIAASAVEIEAKVRELREALEPQAASVSEIPPFNVTLAYELYALMLKPVEASWKPAKSLVVVTNGSLGLLPLSLLPTAPVDVNEGEGALFAAYRNVPWLARTHAVSVAPSIAALRTLRSLPAGPAGRQPLIGFGDPYFNAQEAIEAEGEQIFVAAQTTDEPVMKTRGLPLIRRSTPQLQGAERADVSLLPRLPDTSDELRSIAAALHVDQNASLYLGKAASVRNVEQHDLSAFRVVAFATHGLVPGDLDGLMQPALALSAPVVTGDNDDGLLTMEKILSLRLNADWVVLSACNTGAGAGVGAEAASGLGRAFFYAGTRTVLVTNWSVHSQSARELMTDLFSRQAGDHAPPRSEALRQAMLAMIDGKGAVDAGGATLYAYAHPLFWAPYTIIGDGG